MGLFFSKLFRLFERNRPHKKFLDLYSEIERLSSLLYKNLILLRKIQKDFVAKNLAVGGSGRTGTLGLEKTLFIEEELLQKLKRLAEETESRFLQAGEQVAQYEPWSPLEEEELRRILALLEEISEKCPDISSLSALKSEPDKLIKIENAFREITNLSQKFQEVEQKTRALIREVKEQEISPLLKRVYTRPQPYTYKEKGSVKVLYTYILTENQLRSLEKETASINARQDHNYQIIWRRWWRDLQTPEPDKTTPLKDPHINLTLRLFGGPKKEIHLLLAA